uniref:Protein kinase domain-containing protein n=1 Tax=Denticeps clupeoides TaxID=299321 RepID=A0AAY4D0S7_9TELE
MGKDFGLIQLLFSFTLSSGAAREETSPTILMYQVVTSQDLQISCMFHFDQINEIGSGGYGNVYKAKHKMDGMFYALKIVKYTSQAESEVKNLARCDHQNIVRYYTSSYTDTSSGDQSGSSGTTDFLYMEFCENGTLTTWIEDRNYRNSQRNAEDALTVFKQVVCGVMYIHSQRLIHRDLKPDNILFEKNGDVKIGDFGLVTMITDESGGSVERTLAKGTQSYMSPEQDRRSYDEKTDIFPLGLIFFELLWKFSTRLEKAKVTTAQGSFGCRV